MQMVKTISRVLLLGGALLLVGGAAPRPAAARDINAMIGRADPDFGSCFSINLGSITNRHCTLPASVDFSLPIDNTGTKSVTVSAFGQTGANNVQCIATTTDAFGNLSSQSNGGTYQALPSFGGRTQIHLGAVALTAAAGTLVVNCVLDPGATVYTFDWQP